MTVDADSARPHRASTGTVLVAINPAAAFGTRAAVGPAVVSALTRAGHPVAVLEEDGFEALRAVTAEAVARHPLALVVVGGDGMVGLGAGLVARSGIPLGIVPAGTGNDAARSLGIPIGDTDAAVRALLAALDRPPRLVDAGLITLGDGSTRWFLGVLSAGFDALVNDRANRLRWPRGRLRYVRAVVLELATLAPSRYALDLDGVGSQTRATLVAIANLTSFGGGMRVAPAADADDGMFDVVMLEPVGRMQLLRLFPTVFSGAHIRDPRVSVRRARRVTIDAWNADGGTITAYADGERVGAAPLTVEVVARAVAVLV